MKKRWIALALLLAGSGWSLPLVAAEPPTPQAETVANRQSLSWQPAPSTAGKFVVDLPGTPTEQTSISSLLEREVTWHMTAVTVPAIDETDLFEYYLVAYADVPRSLRYEFSQKELMDAAAASVVADIEDEQLQQTLAVEEIAFQGLPSRLMTGEGLGQFFAATLSLTGDRLYLLLAIDDDQANFEHFYDSFCFIP
jgi:hypothetical protein